MVIESDIPKEVQYSLGSLSGKSWQAASKVTVEVPGWGLSQVKVATLEEPSFGMLEQIK